MAVIDKNIIQKYLSIVADILPTKLNADAQAKLDNNLNNNNIYLLEAKPLPPAPAAPPPELTSAQAMEILSKQRELLTPTCVPDKDCAIELFSAESYFNDQYSSSKTARAEGIDAAALIDSFFLIPSAEGIYSLDINDLNKKILREKSLGGENLKVESITINNNAKDIFTTKSTFQIDVVVNFKELNDLTDQFIEVKLLSDSTRSKKISFLNLIYRFLNAPAPAPTRALADARDSDGVYISLRMKIANNKKSNYQNLIKELNAKQDDVGQYLVTRTFHCIYHKHDIELNATTDAELVKLGVSKPLNNRLKISFVSYEADTGRKDGTVPSTVALKDNVFSLLSTELVSKIGADLPSIKTLSKFLTDIGGLNTQVKLVQDTIDCFNIYRQLIVKDPSQAEKFAAYRSDETFFALGYESTEEKLELQKEKLKKLQESIEQFKFEINRALAWLILSNCTAYEVTVPYRSLGVFQRDFNNEDFKKNFSWADAVTAAQVGTTFGSFGGGLGAFAGGLTGLAAYSTVKAIQNVTGKEIINQDLNINNVRTNVLSIPDKNIKLADTFANRLNNENRIRKDEAEAAVLEEIDTKGPAGASRNSGAANLQKLAFQSEAAINGGGNLEGALGVLGLTTNTQGSAVAANVQVEDFTYPGDKKLQFIFFGDLLSFITANAPEIKIMLGGKCFPTDHTIEKFNFVNYYYYPIYLQNLYEFIANNILKRSDQYYSTEVFLKDCLEQLVKQPLMNSKKTIDESIKRSAPVDIKSVTSVHYNNNSWRSIAPVNPDGLAVTSQYKKINLFDNTKFKDFKYIFNKSKNIINQVPNNDEIRKFLLFFSEDEIRFHDFYDEFNNDSNFGAESTPTFNDKTIATGRKGIFDTDKFDEFIVQKYLFPSLKFNYVATKSALLKNSQVKFSRIDNPNLTLGNIISNNSFLRLPYTFNTDFNVLTSFFLDVGNYIFISPTATSYGSFNKNDFANSNMFARTFGYCGLYVVNKTSLTITFPSGDPANWLAQPVNKYSISGLLVSYGDSIASTINPNSSITDSSQTCTDNELLVGARNARIIN